MALSPSSAVAVPFPFQPTGVYPSIGIALQPFFELLRFEVAKGTRHGTVQFNVTSRTTSGAILLTQARWGQSQ